MQTVDMLQNISPMISDYSLMHLWEFCRSIGIINKVYLEFSTCLLIMKAMAIANDCRVFKANSACNIICTNYYALSVEMQAIYWIINFLLYALFRRLVIVNDALRSTSIPTNTKKVNTWLLYHQFCLGICILFFIRLLITDPLANIFSLIDCSITNLVLAKELNVVKKFKKEFEISAEHRNIVFETSNI